MEIRCVDMNRWYGVGNVVRDPESSVTQDGMDVCKFTVAVNRIKDKDDSGKKVADYIPVRAKGKKAALCREYLHRGKKVGVEGKLETYNYTTQEGYKRSGFEVVLDDITFLYSGDPDKTEHGDVHANDGVIHHDLDLDTGMTLADDVELPF
ncbi:MAG: single-stranded DNA-binding protein [Ruminococcus sp.]|nr:single-stranded DNA-binding protein [Ruminococcus sp.]